MDRKQIYRPLVTQYAIYCESHCGPYFGGEALGLRGNPLNKDNAGQCYTNGYCCGARYGIKNDSEGNNEVTGEGHREKNDSKTFTCVELEVYQVTFEK